MVEKLSKDEFRKALFESLNKKGILNVVKSNMRLQITKELTKNNTVIHPLLSN